MKIADIVWQGYLGCWQDLFVRQNLLAIGYTAWNGYLTRDRGIVICHVKDAIFPDIDWQTETLAFDLSFLAEERIVCYLQLLNIQKEAIDALLVAIATYDPDRQIIVLVVGNGEMEIIQLQDLGIPPAACYEQVQKRRSEFEIQSRN